MAIFDLWDPGPGVSVSWIWPSESLGKPTLPDYGLAMLWRAASTKNFNSRLNVALTWGQCWRELNNCPKEKPRRIHRFSMTRQSSSSVGIWACLRQRTCRCTTASTRRSCCSSRNLMTWRTFSAPVGPKFIDHWVMGSNFPLISRLVSQITTPSTRSLPPETPCVLWWMYAFRGPGWHTEIRQLTNRGWEGYTIWLFNTAIENGQFMLLVGGWATPLKNMSSSVRMMTETQYEWENKKWQPNHQPGYDDDLYDDLYDLPNSKLCKKLMFQRLESPTMWLKQQ